MPSLLLKIKNNSKYIKILITLILIYYLYVITDWKTFFINIGNFNILLLFPITILYFVGVWISVLRWKSILENGLVSSVSIKTLIKIYLIGSFYNNFLPSSIGGDSIRYTSLKDKTHSRSFLIYSIFTERLVGVISSGVTSLVIFILFYLNQSKITGAIFVFEIFFAGLLVFLLIGYIFHNKISKIIDVIFSYQSKYKVLKYIKRFTLSLLNITKLPLKTFVYSFIFTFISFVGNYLLFKGFQTDINVLHIALLNPILMIISFIPISINSIGVKEGANIYFYGLFGFSNTLLLNISILNRILILLYSLTGGILSLKSNIKPHN